MAGNIGQIIIGVSIILWLIMMPVEGPPIVGWLLGVGNLIYGAVGLIRKARQSDG